MGLLRTSSALGLVAALAGLGIACSQSYAPWGDGGCDTFCNRQVGARCRAPVDREKCVTECVNKRDLCPAHQRGLLRCANLEGNIVCDGDTGATKIANCGPAQDEVAVCVSCATFCRAYVSLCTRANDLGECVASCLDPRCRSIHAGAASNCAPPALTCGDDGFPTAAASAFACSQGLAQATACVRYHGGGRAFTWMPERVVADTGTFPLGDASGAPDGGFSADEGTFPN